MLLYTKYLERFEIIKGEKAEVGAIGRLHYLENGKRYIMEDELLYVEPGKVYRSKVSGNGMEIIVETTFTKIEGGTLMTLDWNGKGTILIMKILLPLLRKKIIEGAYSELENFKALVEKYGVNFQKE
jgi:hypothetical protein